MKNTINYYFQSLLESTGLIIIFSLVIPVIFALLILPDCIINSIKKYR